MIAAGGASGWFAAAQYWVAACGVALALIDLAVQRLPDVLTLPACGGTLILLTAAALAGEPGSLGRAAAAAGVLAAVFLLMAFTGAMGLGDVKLAPAIGALLGWNSWTALLWGRPRASSSARFRRWHGWRRDAPGARTSLSAHIWSSEP